MEEWAKIPAAVFLNQILSSIFLLYQLLISCNKMEINYLKIIQFDFLDFFHLSIFCKWENLKNWQCIKYLFAPLYVANMFNSLRKISFFMVSSDLKFKLMRHVTFNPILFWIAPGLISCIFI